MEATWLGGGVGRGRIWAGLVGLVGRVLGGGRVGRAGQVEWGYVEVRWYDRDMDRTDGEGSE